ncbi:MAG TPA: M23 family metallopeptidase [Terriglobales bacterium]|nr:M23 family metallopeptidase [Terriglobales bacterium]
MRFAAVFFSVLLIVGMTSAQPLSDVPVDIQVPTPPSPVMGGGQIHLLYELHLTNFHRPTLTVSSLAISDGSRDLVNYDAQELAKMILHPGAAQDASTTIQGGGRAVIFLDVKLNSHVQAPRQLLHRVCFRGETAGDSQHCIDGVTVSVNAVPPIVLSPPLRGAGWVALNGLSNDSGHRRTLIVVDGKLHLSQRFATDWSRIGPDGLAFRGDPSNLANWSPYGADVLAVADAIVCDVKDGTPENNPAADKKAVPINFQTVGGNYLVLDLGNGHYAFYAHLKPGSLRVKVGDKVRRGQVVASLGNSGNSDAPHLHFQVTDGNSLIGSEGLPYVIDSFLLQGKLSSKSQLVSGGWHAEPKDERQVQRELPLENAVVSFP